MAPLSLQVVRDDLLIAGSLPESLTPHFESEDDDLETPEQDSKPNNGPSHDDFDLDASQETPSDSSDT